MMEGNGTLENQLEATKVNNDDDNNFHFVRSNFFNGALAHLKITCF